MRCCADLQFYPGNIPVSADPGIRDSWFGPGGDWDQQQQNDDKAP